MLDDSISSSPPKTQRSIHAARMHRRNRHRHALKDNRKSLCSKEVPISMDVSTDSETVPERKPKLADLYWEETAFTDSLNTTFLIQKSQNADFDPFEDEMLLAVADNLDCVQVQHRKPQPGPSKTGQGFIKCSQLLEDNKNQPTPPPTIEYNEPQKSKTEFDITESELLQWCNKGENDVDNLNETMPSMTVHKNQKSIVESILEDFCTSPDSPENLHSNNDHANKKSVPPNRSTMEEDRTPVFQYKSQHLRTYSRRCSTVAARANIAERLESVAPAATDAHDNGSCSPVSEEKEITQLGELDLETVRHNKSVTVCENLLNLNDHFSQKSPFTSASPRRESAEISHTRKRNKENSDKIHEVSEVTAENYKGQSPVREEHLNRDELDQTLAEDSSHLSKDPPIPTPASRKPDIHQVYNTAEKEEDIFKDSEEENDWNDDCNFFKNFNTQDVFRRNFSSYEESTADHAEKDIGFQGFTTASKKSITISEKAKQRAAQMIAEIDAELESDFKATQNICVFSQTRKNVATNRTADFQGLPTAAKEANIENVNLNETLNDDAAAAEFGNIQLSEWLIDDCDQKVEGTKNDLGHNHIEIPKVTETKDFKLPEKVQDIPNMTSVCQIPTEEPFPFIGFLTASQKPIEISAEAKAKAEKILETLPDFPKGIPEELAEADYTLHSVNMCEKREEGSPTVIKRKLEHAVEQIPEQAAKVVYNSTTINVISPRTPLATCSDNGPVTTTRFSSATLKEDPTLNSVKKSDIISRRNLLTLTRKKRIKPKETSEEKQTATSTPLKTKLPDIQIQGTPVTPNVRAFFATVPDASTPHAVHADDMQNLGNVKKFKISENLNEMDADFQQIEWGVCNDTSTASKADISSASSSTLVQMEATASPSPKIRIERLSRYGHPPQVSPISMTAKYNCRPSGLRRCRSMNKHK